MLDVGWPDPAEVLHRIEFDPQLLGQLADVLQRLYGHGGLLSR